MMDPAHYMAEYDLTTPDQSVAATRRPLTAEAGQTCPALQRPTLNSAGSTGAFGFTSVNVISFVSPFGNVIFIADHQLRRPVHPQVEPRQAFLNLLPLRHHRHQVGAGTIGGLARG